MALDGKLLAKARGQLNEIRSANSAEQQRRKQLVYSRVPEVETIDRNLQGQMAELAKLTMMPPRNLSERLADLRERNLNLQMRRAELLTEHGWGDDYLDEIFSCPVCHDTGMVESREGTTVTGARICDCLMRLYNRELTRELSSLLLSGDESFEHFNLNYYDDQKIGSGMSPRETMQIVFSSCRKFADQFPAVASNLLLQGGTGLGKTYLSACIARTVAEKGYAVCYDTAVSALGAFETQKFSRDSDEAERAAARVKRMLECDLMILDDLGTEMVTSVSTSALYTLINTRLTAGKKTIISTNLSEEDLQRTYTPQICSRIRGEFLRLPFVGRDIRLIRKGI
ncbi:MAG: ATP-binding protein [Oscillospiraceae bacterium]|nr:ATP-binding protein [Oscillospiraceae bacterium]